MDVLSDVLLAVHLTGAVFFDVDARSPFTTESPPAAVIAKRFGTNADHVIGFHVVTEGSCWAESVDRPGQPVLLHTGDMVIFPGGDANTMGSSPGMRGKPDLSLFYHPLETTLPINIGMNQGADADRCRFVCGYLACDARPFNPLLESLPDIVFGPVSAEAWRWMAALLDAAIEASAGHDAGREAMLAKASELVFVEVLREHIANLPPDTRNWVAGLRDAQVGAALRVIHRRFAEPWTMDLLAHEVGMSRSSFADRFTSFAQVPPMGYLTRWRLQLAARLLQDGSRSVAQAAAAVGYQSESAFNRAFKRQVGVAPGVWRRELHAVG